MNEEHHGWLAGAGLAIVGALPAWMSSKARERAAIQEQVAQCMKRLTVLEERLDAKDADIKELHIKIDAKSERISQLEKLPLCQGPAKCWEVASRDVRIAQLEKELVEPKNSIQKLPFDPV